jgi:hypothetical protein
MEGQDAAPFPRTSSLLKERPFPWCISGVHQWLAYPIAAWTDSFLRQAMMSSQMIDAKRKTGAAYDGTSPMGAKPSAPTTQPTTSEARPDNPIR